MSSYDRIGHFLRKKPTPASVRTDAGDKVAIGADGAWVKNAREAIEGLAWERLEALSADGSILRSLASDVEQEQEQDLGPLESTETIVRLADLLERAADRAAARHESAYHMAFERYGQLVEVLANRLVGVEQAWSKAMVERARLLGVLAEQEGKTSGNDDMMSSLVSSMVSGAMSTPAKPAGGNGKAT